MPLLSIHTSLNDPRIVLRSMRGREALSELFSFELEIDSHELSLRQDSFLFKNISIQIQTHSTQLFNGIVAEFSERPHFTYRLKLVPTLWKLNQLKRSRIFSNTSVIDLIKLILKEEAEIDYELDLFQVYPEREYCIQYQESDFEFMQRLLAEEGIRYYFKHSLNQHIWVLTDQVASAQHTHALYHHSEIEEGYLIQWNQIYRQTATQLSSGDYNFKSPQDPLQLTQNLSFSNTLGKLEQHFYPGAYQNYEQGKHRLSYKAKSYLAENNFFDARSYYLGLSPNHLVQLANKAPHYLVTEMTHTAHSYTDRAAISQQKSCYQNHFKCIQALDFRAPTRQKPGIANAQVAQVVGTPTETPDFILHGEILIQLSWDENATALRARLAQPWAGKDWGLHLIPRVGDPVLVYFLNADPERAIIWGGLHDDLHPPLYDKHSSGIKTRGSDSTFNELRFEDSEHPQLYWQAARNFEQHVGRDEILHAKNTEITVEQGKYTLDVGHHYTLSATKSIVLQAGESSIRLLADKIIIAASDIKLN